MSFDIRETRLRNDYQRVRDLANRSDLIHIIRTEGDPPEKYLIRYTCRAWRASIPPTSRSSASNTT